MRKLVLYIITKILKISILFLLIVEKNFALPNDIILNCDTVFVKIDTMVACTSFFKNGRIKSLAQYKNWKRHGVNKDYYENGQLEAIIRYDEGCVQDTNFGYHANGKLHYIAPYINCKENGMWLSYDSTGKKISEVFFKDGINVGLQRKWYPSGQLAEEQNYNEEGKSEGRGKAWYENGQLMYELFDLKGKPFWTKYYYESGKLRFEEKRDSSGITLREAFYFTPDGKPCGSIKNGNGTFIKFLQNNKIMRYTYENNRKVKSEDITNTYNKNEGK